MTTWFRHPNGDVQTYIQQPDGNYKPFDGVDGNDPLDGEIFTYDEMMNYEANLDDVAAKSEEFAPLEEAFADGSNAETTVHVTEGGSLQLDGGMVHKDQTSADDPTSDQGQESYTPPELEGRFLLDPDNFVDAAHRTDDGRTDPADHEGSASQTGAPPKTPLDWVDGGRDDFEQPDDRRRLSRATSTRSTSSVRAARDPTRTSPITSVPTRATRRPAARGSRHQMCRSSSIRRTSRWASAPPRSSVMTPRTSTSSDAAARAAAVDGGVRISDSAAVRSGSPDERGRTVKPDDQEFGDWLVAAHGETTSPPISKLVPSPGRRDEPLTRQHLREPPEPAGVLCSRAIPSRPSPDVGLVSR